jgi:hypothetical protein
VVLVVVQAEEVNVLVEFLALFDTLVQIRVRDPEHAKDGAIDLALPKQASRLIWCQTRVEEQARWRWVRSLIDDLGCILDKRAIRREHIVLRGAFDLAIRLLKLFRTFDIRRDKVNVQKWVVALNKELVQVEKIRIIQSSPSELDVCNVELDQLIDQVCECFNGVRKRHAKESSI